ncbi:MAG: efflux RND transporter permease subunit [Chryseosolibacter sp.]
MQDSEKEFRPTSWAIDNKVAIYVATVIISLMGIVTYITLPKENFPEVVFPQIYVATPYPGAAPSDIENLITKHIEKQVKSISGVKKISSNSIQNFSNVIIEFEADVDVDEAKREVSDAVDRAKPDLPANLPDDPIVQEIDISEVPIMFVNLSGDYDLKTIKRYAEMMQDRFESLREIRRVDIVGALDREIQINVDIYKAALAGVDLNDVAQAIGGENVLIPGGQVSVDGMKRSVSVNGEYVDAREIANTVVGSIQGGKVFLKDIAEVVDTHKEQESFARLDKENVITLNIIKRSGENLVEAADQINAIIADYEKGLLPEGLKVTVTADQSENTRVTLHDLINTIIIGFVLVTIILMFFMGVTNAIFVGLSVPISSFIAFLVFPAIGFTLNMMTLFSFLLALGIVVDDAIVVIENTHRVFDNGKVPIRRAAKIAAGEVFLPVLTGTLVVLAPFIPLAFWPGVVGKFMMYLPITLIIALLASLLVAYIINPVFAADFMKPHEHETKNETKSNRGFKVTSVIFAGIALVSYLISFGVGNFIVFIYLLYALHHFLLKDVITKFQNAGWPKVQRGYKRILTWCLYRYRPLWVVAGVVGLFIFALVFTGIRNPPVVFFPNGDPNFIYTFIRMPIGTDQRVTDSITSIVEARVIKAIGEDNPVVESVISNVAIGASDNPFDAGTQATPHLGKVSVAFVKFSERGGQSTRAFMDDIREAVRGIKGAEITVNSEANGPPTGKPVNIEVAADDFELLVKTADDLQRFLEKQQVPGVEELKSDFQSDKPEIVINIDREKANREGISTGQIGQAISTAVYGYEISRFRDANDDYPIQLRIREEQRNDLNTLINMPITYRDMGMGGVVRQVPLSAVATVQYSNNFAGIKRIDQKRVVTISSNVLASHNENAVVADITERLKTYNVPDGVTVEMTGAQEDQAETGSFLMLAFGLAGALMFMILVIQFNSISKPLIILSEILFSIIGVLIGFSLFKMEISIIMTGVGIMALAGLVVRNGILLVEFTELLRSQGIPLYQAIIEAAKTRMTPVLLTTIAATIGLIPLAVGFNIDFVTLFTDFDPQIYFGGDNAAFWAPLSWTMIFGLLFGTFLTLVLVPVLYLLAAKLKERIYGIKTTPAPGTEGAVAVNRY